MRSLENVSKEDLFAEFKARGLADGILLELASIGEIWAEVAKRWHPAVLIFTALPDPARPLPPGEVNERWVASCDLLQALRMLNRTQKTALETMVGAPRFL